MPMLGWLAEADTLLRGGGASPIAVGRVVVITFQHSTKTYRTTSHGLTLRPSNT